jgi:hypothetical protein
VTGTTAMDALADVKQHDRAMWALGDLTRVAEPLLGVGRSIVRTVGVGPGDEVLDAACGTGNAALPAARTGARVVGLDLAPELLAVAAAEADRTGVEVEWVAGDVEAMPFEDERFDVVLSTFGSMFAPQHRVTAREQARVLAPGGRMGLCCWTPEGLVGDLLRTLGSFLPAPPEFFSPATLWGTEQHVRDLFDGTGLTLAFHCDSIDLRFGSTAAAVEAHLDHFGPVAFARERAEQEGHVPALRHALTDLFERHRSGPGDALTLPSEYLVAVGRKAG